MGNKTHGFLNPITGGGFKKDILLFHSVISNIYIFLDISRVFYLQETSITKALLND